MAKSELLFQIIRKWEGGWSDHKKDRGGKTNMGITLRTWKSCGYDKDGDGDIDADDLRLITPEDVFNVFKKYYWDRYKADFIHNQSVANICVDWVWASGSPGITRVQQLLQIKVDGIVGSQTIATINLANQRELFERIKSERIQFVEELCVKDPTQLAFRKGWLNRINDFKFSKY